MPGLGKTRTVRGSARVRPARSQEIYQRYAVALYRQALLSLGDSASAGHVACDPVVNECALAVMPERGEDDARYRLAELVFRRSGQLAARLAQRDRRSGQGALGLVLSGGLGYIRVSATLGIHPREMAALLRAVLRKLTTSPLAEDGENHAGTWIRHGDHHGGRRNRAWGAGGQGTAGHAAVCGNEEDVTRVGRSQATSSAVRLPGRSGAPGRYPGSPVVGPPRA